MSARVVVTGANRGLGLALATAWRERDATVLAGCRRPSEAAQLAATGATVLPLDTGDDESIQDFAAAVGATPIDVLVNNAGVDARTLVTMVDGLTPDQNGTFLRWDGSIHPW